MQLRKKVIIYSYILNYKKVRRNPDLKAIYGLTLSKMGLYRSPPQKSTLHFPYIRPSALIQPFAQILFFTVFLTIPANSHISGHFCKLSIVNSSLFFLTYFTKKIHLRFPNFLLFSSHFQIYLQLFQFLSIFVSGFSIACRANSQLL